MATVTVIFSSKPILYRSWMELLIEKPENDTIVRAFLDQEDRSEFGERSPQRLFCARRCTYREQLAIRSAVGGSFHRSNSGRR